MKLDDWRLTEADEQNPNPLTIGEELWGLVGIIIVVLSILGMFAVYQ